MSDKLRYIGEKFVSIFLKLVLAITILSVVSGFAFYYFLSIASHSPIELTKISNYAESRFTKQNPDLLLTIGKMTAQYYTIDKKLEINIENITIKDKNNHQWLSIPQSNIDILFKNISIHNLLPTEINILEPGINLHFVNSTPSKDGINFDKNIINHYYNKIINSLAKSNLKLVDNIIINNMKITLDSQYDWHIIIPDINISSNHYIGITHINSTIDYEIEHEGNTSGSLTIDITHNKWNNHLSQKIAFTPVPLSNLIDVITDLGMNVKIDKYIQDNPIFSGSITLESTSKDFFKSLNTEITFNQFTFDNKEIFEEPINVISTYFKLNCINWCQDVNIQEYTIKTDDNINIKSNGKLLYNLDKYDISLTFELPEFSLDLLSKYWPLGLADNPRTWMISHMPTGDIAKTTGNTSLQYNSKNGWLLKQLSINMPFKNTKLIYDLDLEPITNIDGSANFTTDSILIEANSGDLLNSKVTDARVTIPYCLGDEIKNLTIYGNTIGPAKDLLYFVNKESLKFAVSDYDLDKTSGDAKTHINLSIPMDNNVTYNDLTYNISTYITNATLPAIYKNYELTNAAIHILLTNAYLNLKGEGNIEKVKATFSTDIDLINNKFTKPLEIDMELESDLILSLLPSNKIVTIEGAIPAQIMIDMNNKNVLMQLDVTNNKMLVPILNFTKKPGHKMDLALSLDKLDKNDKFTLKAIGDDISLDGEVIYDSSIKKCTYINIPKATLGEHNIELLYSSLAGTNITLYSDYVDISSLNLKDFINNQDSEGKTEINMSVDTMIMKNDNKFTDLKVAILCNKSICEYANLQALSSKNIAHSLVLDKSTTQHNFTFKSGDLGVLLKALDISKNVVGGNLILETSAPINSKNLIYNGNILVNDYYLENTPAIMNLFGLTSFATFINQNKKNGLPFHKLEGPVSFQDDIIKIKDVRAIGKVLDMSFTGRINLQDMNLAISGYIIPSVYGINNLLTHIPLIGKLLVGKGLFSTQFFISGPLDNPRSTINPLSVITPGFLNNLIPY